MSELSMSVVWNDMAGRRVEVIEAFYQKLFQRHPQYRALFPESMGAQMEKMVEMLGAVIRFAENVDVIRPYLHEAARAHRRLGIDGNDLRRFTDALLDTLAEECAEVWDDEQGEAWRAAIDDVLIPAFEAALRSSE